MALRTHFSWILPLCLCLVSGQALANGFVEHLVRGRVHVVGKAKQANRAARPERLRLEQKGSDPKVVIESFHSPDMRNAQGKPRWSGPGKSMTFEMVVKYEGRGELPYDFVGVHTNVNQNASPGTWLEHRMQRVKTLGGNRFLYRAEIPVERVGNYQAKGFVAQREGEKVQIKAWSPGENLRFRPYAVEHDLVNETIYSLRNIGANGQIGTFEDAMGRSSGKDGKYTLSELRDRGFTAVRLLPIKSHSQSPFTQKAFYLPWVQHSKKGRTLAAKLEAIENGMHKSGHGDRPRSRVRAKIAQLKQQIRKETLLSIKRFIAEAHGLGIKVIMDEVRNHGDVAMALNDIFFRDAQGQPMDIFDPGKEAASFEVRRNDLSQLAPTPEMRVQMEKRMEELAREGKPINMNTVAPFVYARWENGPDPKGAINHETAVPGGWFEWPKPTTNYNHGGGRHGYSFFDYGGKHPHILATRRYLMRELAFWVMMGVDGFRLDHGSGMPSAFFTEDLNKLQAVADRYRPGTNLLTITEDYHTHDKTMPFSDLVERGEHRLVLGAKGPGGFRNAMDAGWRQNSAMSTGNHDEEPAPNWFGNQLKPYKRLKQLALATGGPVSQMMTAELGNREGIEFRHGAKTPRILFERSRESETLASEIGSVAWARQHLPALRNRGREHMKDDKGQWNDRILAMARFDQDKDQGPLAVVLSNFLDTRQSHKFIFGDAAKGRLNAKARYMARDFASSPAKDLWDKPKTGAELAREGIAAFLDASQTQIIDLRKIEGGKSVRYDPAPRKPLGGALEID